jgi:hypothetical protein
VRDIGPFSRGHRADFPDLDLSGDHLVPETRDDLGEQLESVTPLVRDEDTQMLNLVVNHRDQEM